MSTGDCNPEFHRQFELERFVVADFVGTDNSPPMRVSARERLRSGSREAPTHRAMREVVGHAAWSRLIGRAVNKKRGKSFPPKAGPYP